MSSEQNEHQDEGVRLPDFLIESGWTILAMSENDLTAVYRGMRVAAQHVGGDPEIRLYAMADSNRVWIGVGGLGYSGYIEPVTPLTPVEAAILLMDRREQERREEDYRKAAS